MSLLEEAIAAHGGMERWRELKRIKLKLRCGGIAMALKGRPGVLRELAASVDHHCLVHERVDGLLFATRRRGVPRGLPGPPLVTISIDDITLH